MTQGARILPLACGAALIVLTALRAATYDWWADGDWGEYTVQALFSLAVGGGTWVLVRLSLGVHRRAGAFAWVAALLILVPGDAVHYQRIAHPLTRTRQQVITDEFGLPPERSPHTWIVQRTGTAKMDMIDDAVRISSPPGSTAFLELVLPGLPQSSLNEFWLPRGLYNQQFDETLEWEASASLSGSFSVMLETRDLLIQVAPFGLHVTYPNERRQVTQHHVERPAIVDGTTHRFRLERVNGLVRLRVDDAPSWVHPDTGRFQTVRFGETRADPMHGGTLTLHQVRYTRRYAEK